MLLLVRADPETPGGATVDANACYGMLCQVQFEGFNLFGSTPYAALADEAGNPLSDAFAVELYGAGAAGLADFEFTDDRLATFLGSSPKKRCRLGLFTEEDGWLAFAEITVNLMPTTLEVLGSSCFRST